MDSKLKDIEQIYHAALEKSAGPDRDRYLDTACGRDTGLRGCVEDLLKAIEKAGDFLEIPPVETDFNLDISPQLVEVPGTIIGRYKILEKIGEGGMAVVYMAEQEKPIRRKVALKIIKLGMDTKSVIARFEAERQALAIMDHPNIAKVLDAGATDKGRPYFVMELVKGASITDFCDKNNLSTQKRLELFIQICNAVQHAHQKGIIHRDIKPTNVLITYHDSIPVPKVIDFGIAKATNQRLTEKTFFTRYAQMIGTPAYMSPEQAELSDSDVDTRTDIYSLGVLLYELLTGATPFGEERLRQVGYLEMQRIILKEQPTKPSTKLSDLKNTITEIARRRRTGPETLKKLIKGDLDWIVMKSLEKDRTRRYDSTGELGAEIQRHLNHEPVLAGPPSALYRIKKFVQRHHVLVIASAAIAASIIVGLIISTSLYLRMRQALNTVSQLEDKAEIYNKLTAVQRLYAEGRYQAALNELEAMQNEQNLGPEAQLLRARLLVEVGQFKNAEAQLLPLTKAEPQIAGAAHYLLARVNIGVDTAKVKEHEALAVSMLPNTAEAYALRAMTASSMDQALQWLDRAIALDPAHYPSRKTRVLIYYTQGEDQKMAEDVGAIIALRPSDSIGYSLRAILRRESGRFEEAVADHARAIELCESETELIEIYDQRYETYTKMGNHSAALEDARLLTEFDQQTIKQRFRIFLSLLAMKDFAAAKSEYRTIVQANHLWEFRFNQASANYVFDILNEGQTFEVPPEWVQQAPFAYMQRAAQCYHAFASKATCIALKRQGFLLLGMSPDSKELLCGWTVLYEDMLPTIRGAVPTVFHDTSLKIINIESGQERHVASAYQDSAAWSPDGKYIAFVDLDQDICIVPAEGGKPRKLVSGLLPQWSKDSQRLYFWTGWSESQACYINIHDPNPTPQKLMKTQGRFVINENENWIAIGNTFGVEILDVSSGSLLYQYPSPWALGILRLSLTPDGRELCIRTWSSSNGIGPLILDMQDNQLYQMFDYPVDSLFRSQDGSKLVIGVRPKAWIMQVDPNLPICQTLGQKIPGNDLITDQIEKKSRAIAADPLYPENYLRRAMVYMSLGQYEKAESDLQQFDALVTSDDHHVGYEIFQLLRQYYINKLYEEAELLAPHAERLMKRFPADVPSYRDLITEIAERFELRGMTELAAMWSAILKDLDKKDM